VNLHVFTKMYGGRPTSAHRGLSPFPPFGRAPAPAPWARRPLNYAFAEGGGEHIEIVEWRMQVEVDYFRWDNLNRRFCGEGRAYIVVGVTAGAGPPCPG
jgi:hypothetical protein